MTLYSEITEQPDRIKSLLFSQRKTVEQIAAEIQKRDIQYVFLAARGTSDNAGRYANYLLGAQNGLPLALATPSLFTYYKQPPKLKNALVHRHFAIRQVARYCQRFGRRQKAKLPDSLDHQRAEFSAGAGF